MKRYISFIASLLLLIFPITLLAEDITVTVKGMVCSFCAQGIKKTFSKKDSVETTNVDLDKKTVSIKTKDGKELKDEEIRQSIVDAGFEVVSIERKKNA